MVEGLRYKHYLSQQTQNSTAKQGLKITKIILNYGHNTYILEFKKKT